MRRRDVRDAWNDGWMGRGHSLVLWPLRVEIHALHTHQLKIVIHEGSAQLVGRQLNTEEEGGSRLGWSMSF
jgi:hypothetical protein